MAGRIAALAFLAFCGDATFAAAETTPPARLVLTSTPPHAGQFWQYAILVRDDPSVTRMSLGCLARLAAPLRTITRTFRDASIGEIVATTCSFQIPRNTAGQTLRVGMSTTVETREGDQGRVSHADGAIRIWKIRR